MKGTSFGEKEAEDALDLLESAITECCKKRENGQSGWGLNIGFKKVTYKSVTGLFIDACCPPLESCS
jgi:hypothetical protein